MGSAAMAYLVLSRPVSLWSSKSYLTPFLRRVAAPGVGPIDFWSIVHEFLQAKTLARSSNKSRTPLHLTYSLAYIRDL